MGQAEHLLIDTDFTMGQIAQMIGYSTSSRFAELFQEEHGAFCPSNIAGWPGEK